ncbi:transport and Golgi organization protein 1 homolog isoform X2 [Salmo salar]|uniref:Transport and Golgi organization protein 1 homolog n=1 Tax=Salmo salar TaxID=8030 RepID=A0A1S3M8Z2_SALSA|nr:transport and Golgi organization protein 1 homolog isoform X2 [Salmo salar]|eukprot:XP_013999474.1 PREDICTED: melanoma inhibitory activity protein 3-like isoform X2 [Salmo salar]
MAVNVSHVYILLVFINNFISNAATERRFSDFKRCADEECSLLLCRGKASSDFTGPDCRFLSFKKGETVYVYYKLSGRRTDIWAGSVGNRFGYFHKDQLAINHIYTEKELEIPAQETDFVCFDTGHDKFDSYDIESLLVSSLLLTDQDKSVQGTTETLDRNKSAESTTVEVEEPPPEVTLLENDEIDSDVPEDIDKVLEEVLEEFPEDKDPGLFDPLESSLPQPETVIEALDAKGVESNTVVEPNTVVERTAERIKDDLQKYQLRTEDSVPDSVVEPEQGEAKESLSEPLSKDDPELENAPDGFSEGRPVPELKTILGTTFDAVTSDDEETRKVTPYDEEDEGSDEGSEEFEYQQDEKSDYHLRETPLLAFSEEHSNLEHKDILESEQTDEEESPPETAEKQDSKDLWSSLGDTVFNIVSGGERTAHVTGSEEEDDDEDDEGEIAPEEPPKIEEPKENIQLLANDPKQEPEVTEQPHEEPVVSNFLEEAVKMPDVESQTLLFEDEPEGHIEPSTPPADEVIPFEHTEEALAENLTVNESPVPKHVSQTEMLSDFDSNTSDSEQTQAVEELPIQKEPKENIQLLANDPKQEPEVTEQPHEVIFEEPIDSDFLEAVKMPDVDSQTLQLEDEPEGDIEPSIPLDDEVIPFEHTEEALAENLTVNESPVPKHVSQTELLSDFDSKTNVSEQKQAIELPIQKESRDFSQVENKLKRGGTELFRRLRGPNVPDPTKNTMVKERHEELPVDKEDLIDPENLEIEEELLEDENAALSFSSKTEYTDEDKESRLEFGSEQSNNATETEVVSSDELDVVQIEEAIDIEPEEHDIEDSESAGLDQTHTPSLEDKVPDLLSGQEPEYSDNVLRLTLLRSHFKEEDMARFQKILGLQNLFRVEFLFSDLEQELNAALMSQTNTSEDIEKVLEAILEASETPILDEIESMLDARENADVQQETELDEEATILDNFQELAFTLHQKYSTTSDSSPLAEDSQLHPDTDGDVSDAEEEQTFPHSVGDIKEDNLTVTETGEETKAPEEKPDHEGHNRPDLDMGLEEDVGHFNRNQDNQPEEIQRGPQAILENTLDMGLVDMEHPSSGSLESPPVSDFQEEEQSGSSFVSVLIFSGSLVTLVYEYLGIYAVMMVTCLPEEWKPGPDFYGVSWEPVLVTAGAGFIGFLFLFWRSVLSVKRKSYLTTEKEMADRMKTFEQEKEEILLKVAELQQQGEELKEKKRLSEKSATSSLEKILELKNLVQEMERQNECLDEEKNLLARSFDEERTKTAKHQDMMSEMDKTIEKLKRSRKKTQEALSKATILMEEAKLREDARNVQHQVLEKDIATLREENISLHHAANLWEEKHREMSEQIKVYQKSQKDLEDSLAQKDHNVEVLSDLLGDLEACDDLKGGVVANGEAANDKQTVIRNRIKQMMDVTRVQTTLSVVEEERDRFMTKLLNEEKARKELEEQYQKLEHDILLVKSDKNHLENQYKTLQQKNEIITEMYQQKENALQQKLTKEEFERRNNEDRLTEVDGKALEAEEEVKVCRQRIKEIQDELKQTEKSYKAQIIEQEQKSHENWVIARAAERALLDEKKESTNLRIKLTEMSSKLNELRRPLFKPTPGMAPMPLRRGDSYGPSPVSGGAPSPPLMMEGPGRPPSAPVGRRNEPYGPRPPSDPHGRYPPDHKHPVAARPDAIAPRTSSPSSLDSSTAPPQSQAEAQASTENPEANSGPRGPGSLLVSPISSPPDSGPGPLSHPSGLCYRPPPGPGPHHIPPPPLFMPPMYRPANGPNGQPGMMPPGPPPPNGHPPGPMMPPGQRPPPPGAYGPSHHRGPPPPHYGPVPPPFGVRGGPPMARPMGPPRPYMHYAPRDHSIPPQHLPTGAAPYPPHGGPRDFPGQPPMQQAPHGHDSSVGPQGQDYSSQQAAATPQPQDSVSSSMAEP